MYTFNESNMFLQCDEKLPIKLLLLATVAMLRGKKDWIQNAFFATYFNEVSVHILQRILTRRCSCAGNHEQIASLYIDKLQTWVAYSLTSCKVGSSPEARSMPYCAIAPNVLLLGDSSNQQHLNMQMK